MPGYSGDWGVSPTSQNAAVNTPTGPYTIIINIAPAPAGGQKFLLSDNGAGGTFKDIGGNTVTSLTIAQGGTQVQFTYQNGSIGTNTLTVTPSTGPLNGESFLNVQAVIGANASPTGFKITPAVFQEPVGISTPNYLLTLTNGANPAIANGDPSAAPTLASGSTGGSLSNGSWYGVVYTWKNAAGESKASPVGTVQIAGAGQVIQVTGLGTLPPGATSVNWYTTAAQASQAAAQSAALAFYANNNGAGFNITAAGSGAAPPSSNTMGGLSFTLSDASAGGAFTPGTTVTIPQGQSSVGFAYKNGAAGNYLLTATTSGFTLSANNTATTLAVFTGAAMATGMLFNASDVIWTLGYMKGTQTYADDTPFGTLINFTLKDDVGVKELMGPESLTPIAVGVTDKKITGEAQWCRVRIRQWFRLRGGTAPSTQAALANPTITWTPTLGTQGSLTVAAGATEVAICFTFANAYGQTMIGPIQTASLNSTLTNNSVTLPPLSSLPAAVTALNVYMTSQGYATGTSLTQTLYFVGQTPVAAGVSTAFVAQNFPLTTNAVIPTANNLGNAWTLYKITGADVPTTYNLHLMNPSDGSMIEMYVYGVFAPSLQYDFKLRDFVQPKITFTVYGDGNVPPTLMACKLPGDQTPLWV